MEKVKKPYSKPDIKHIDLNDGITPDDTEETRRLREKAAVIAAEFTHKSNPEHKG